MSYLIYHSRGLPIWASHILFGISLSIVYYLSSAPPPLSIFMERLPFALFVLNVLSIFDGPAFFVFQKILNENVQLSWLCSYDSIESRLEIDEVTANSFGKLMYDVSAPLKLMFFTIAICIILEVCSKEKLKMILYIYIIYRCVPVHWYKQTWLCLSRNSCQR